MQWTQPFFYDRHKLVLLFYLIFFHFPCDGRVWGFAFCLFLMLVFSPSNCSPLILEYYISIHTYCCKFLSFFFSRKRGPSSLYSNWNFQSLLLIIYLVIHPPTSAKIRYYPLIRKWPKTLVEHRIKRSLQNTAFLLSTLSFSSPNKMHHIILGLFLENKSNYNYLVLL